jgi:hypothetical protein
MGFPPASYRIGELVGRVERSATLHPTTGEAGIM